MALSSSSFIASSGLVAVYCMPCTTKAVSQSATGWAMVRVMRPPSCWGIVGGFIQLLHAVQLHFGCGAYRIAGQFRFGQQAGFFQHYAVQQGILLCSGVRAS